ncbi:MAG TPA: hypothetical protein VMF67_00940 [Rhizomicrobium sp.]|nr:hypothetical protein [Rhizomicrobium sp.]
MFKKILLSTAAIALIATAANARPNVMLSKDNRFVSVMPGKASPVHTAKKGSYYWQTIATNPDGAYFCCYGSTLSGPSSFFGAAYGVAEQFVLSKAAKVGTLSAGVGYVSGDDSVTLTLYADNGSNEPGAMLAQGTGSTDTEFGECCGITTAKISKTDLKANTPYWVAITTTGSNFEAAGFQVYNEVNDDVYLAGTSNGGTTWGTSYEETEYDPAIGVSK